MARIEIGKCNKCGYRVMARYLPKSSFYRLIKGKFKNYTCPECLGDSITVPKLKGG